MSARKVGEFKWQMMELSDGITTSNGNWYHITSEQIEKYTPGLLKKYPLERIIKEADAWVKSADGLSLLLFFLLVYVSVTPWIAALISIAFFMIWYFNTSAFLFLSASPVIKLITTDGFAYLASSVLLMGIAFNEFISAYGLSVDFSALWIGLLLFFLFKVGLLRLLIRFIQSRGTNSGIEIQDRVLNMLLIRYGMKSGILTGKISEMQDRLIDIANYHKTRKKK
ncbi:MAG: hypothetical protein JJ971_08365 [Balneolaceae bacterium]|nr:hypothetical protein [Balneolaceae bacterium]MBO6546748.1 hypothetical protein [Balneolaceae bacterium]MBO6649106.1 hypothetical protein [Balneolaceae bacterium]